MYDNLKATEGWMSLADWKNSRKADLIAEKKPLLSVNPAAIEKKAINQVTNTEAPSSPLQSKYDQFDFTTIKDILEPPPNVVEPNRLTPLLITKALTVGVISSIPFIPLAISLGKEGYAIVAGVITIISVAYCYMEYKKIKAPDAFLLPEPPKLSTVVRDLSSTSEKGKVPDLNFA